MTYFDAVREASANDHRRVHKAALDVRIQATRDSLASMRNERTVVVCQNVGRDAGIVTDMIVKVIVSIVVLAQHRVVAHWTLLDGCTLCM